MGLTTRPTGNPSIGIGSYGNTKKNSEIFEKYSGSKNINDVLDRYATGKSAGAAVTAGAGFGVYAHYKGNGKGTMEMAQKLGIAYDYGIFERKNIYGKKEVNSEYIQVCGATGKTKYCGGSHTDEFSPYLYKDEYKVGRAVGGTIERGKEMIGDTNGPSITHAPTGHTWDLGAHGFPSTYY